MDFILDYISVNTFWTILAIVHALLAVALLGRSRIRPSLCSLRCAPAPRQIRHALWCGVGSRYAGATCVLWILTFIFGAWIYTRYRVHVRLPIEQEGLFKTLGAFELKEHLTTIGLGLLPVYWYLWKNVRNAAYTSARKWLTVVLAAICWYAFLTGHVLNNVRGFGS